MNNKFDKHIIYMKKGKNGFTNMMSKLDDKYIKHASFYEIKLYEHYYMNNEHHNLTCEQVINEAQELKAEIFHLDPEQYIDAFGENVIWLDVHYRNKEVAKRYKALWEPRLKMWYTYINHPQAIKLIEWMTQQDIDRLQDHLQEQEELHNQYQSIIETRRKQLSSQRKKATIESSIGNVRTR